jgi:hypothetical protein
MRSLSTTALLLFASCLCRLASAQGPESVPPEEYAPAHTGFQVGFRWSAQLPAGSLGRGANLSDLLGPRMHLAVDIGSKVNPHVFVGGYVGGSYGLQGGTFSTACSNAGTYDNGSGSSCSTESLDGGAILILTFAPSGLVDPWMSVAMGYEVQGLNYVGVSGTFSGLSPSALAGIDFRLRTQEHKSFMSLGPYAGITAQKYLTASLGGSTMDAGSEPIHAWVHFGLRFTFPS